MAKSHIAHYYIFTTNLFIMKFSKFSAGSQKLTHSKNMDHYSVDNPKILLLIKRDRERKEI